MRGKPRFGPKPEGNKSKLHLRCFILLVVGIIFYGFGSFFNGCRYFAQGNSNIVRNILSVTGAKTIEDVAKTYLALETKYEASLQTIKDLELQKEEQTRRNIAGPLGSIGSVDKQHIPGIKPPQVIQTEVGVKSKPVAQQDNLAQVNTLRGALPRMDTKRGMSKTPIGKTALVIICFNRAQYLKRTLDSVLKYFPKDSTGPDVYISQDGANTGVTREIEKFSEKFNLAVDQKKVTHLRHDQSGVVGNGYEKLAVHFGWALRKLFDVHGAARAIILEDDLEIAPDFFEYFRAMAPLLDADTSILAVSAWNDNGQARYIADSAAVLRSDFFPGLGWMLNKRLWDELGPKWPRGYWDDWLREPRQRKNRVTLRPEVCRTYTFGKNGVSHAQFFGQYLGSIKLNDKAVSWNTMDLSYLSKDVYDEHLEHAVSSARLVDIHDIRSIRGPRGGGCTEDLKMEYSSLSRGRPPSFSSLAQALGIMGESKARVPRTAYKGIVQIRCGEGMKYRVFLVPSASVELT
eukprot:Stramenopile-MAST_4_protein_3400